jgi:hypothetical protein
MTEEGVIDEAAINGFELEERACGNAWVWGSARGDDQRCLCFLGMAKR